MATSSSSIFKTGNTAVITGGASGIGRALTKKCAAAGMKVLVVDFNPATLKTLGDDKELGGSVATVEADVSKIADWDRVKSVVEDKFGGMISPLSLSSLLHACSFCEWAGCLATPQYYGTGSTAEY